MGYKLRLFKCTQIDVLWQVSIKDNPVYNKTAYVLTEKKRIDKNLYSKSTVKEIELFWKMKIVL